ncbi:hypothetical protein [Nitrogeniibacter aestuarii]|uniref:hypothetical protein n=1 Tax=Nitrogeniibacter aestuarii TaxID=2815343 RepID=UPI001E48AE89|nr:hypothetical protein [Nitrogeniibacter aestuarii]
MFYILPRSLMLGLLTLLLVSGCATTPNVVKTPEKFAHVLRIAVAKPEPTKYQTVVNRANEPVMIGILPALLGLTPGPSGPQSLGMSTSKDLNKDFTVSLENALAGRGYAVSEFKPIIKRESRAYVKAEVMYPFLQNAPDDTDAVLLLRIHAGYFAIGSVYPYKRDVVVDYALFDRLSGDVIVSGWRRFEETSDEYSFMKLSDLKSRRTFAIGGLYDAGMSMLPGMLAEIDKARSGQ